MKEPKIIDYVARGFTPIYEFYLLAKEHSAENVHILTRNRSDSILAKQLDSLGVTPLNKSPPFCLGFGCLYCRNGSC